MSEPGFHTLLFHALYKDESHRARTHPLLYISLDELESSIKVLLDNGYRFLDPAELSSCNGSGTDILLTFDDGYYDNYHALEVLEKYSIRALFFYVEHHIVEQKLFWWEVYFRKRIAETSFHEVYEEMQELKKLPRTRIESMLKDRYGEDCFEPEDDLNRPMTVDELKKFAAHPLVEIGVHSASHEILTHCTREEIVREMEVCKRFLEEVTEGTIPFISYPNGDFNEEVLTVAGELGFEWGFTTLPGLNRRKNFGERSYRLSLRRNAFPMPNDGNNVVRQVEVFAKQNRRQTNM